ncbi:rhodanese-like domain-containing protein [Streptococcus dentasini]
MNIFEKLAQGALLVDVRNAEEYEHSHIAGSQLRPVDRLRR